MTACAFVDYLQPGVCRIAKMPRIIKLSSFILHTSPSDLFYEASHCFTDQNIYISFFPRLNDKPVYMGHYRVMSC